jgi:hypothetical protein
MINIFGAMLVFFVDLSLIKFIMWCLYAVYYEECSKKET